MSYFRSLFFNFLAVMTMARMAPGLEISLYDKVPNFGGSLFFALIVGLLNASVFPLCFILGAKPSKGKIAFFTALLSFGSFLFVYFIPVGVRALSFLGVILGGTVVWAIAFCTNYLEWHRGAKR
jgi:hypothetical protein